MRKIIVLPLSFFWGVTIFFGINASSKIAKADFEFTDPDAFTFTDPASNSNESCPSCAEVSLNLSIPTTSETPKDPPPVEPPPVTPPPSSGGGGGGGSSGGGSSGGSSGGGGSSSGSGNISNGGVSTVKKETATTTIEQKISPTATSTTISKEPENVSNEKKTDSPSFTSLFGLNKELAETLSSDESKQVTGRQARVQFSGSNLNLYKKIILKETAFSEKVKINVAYFIENGTPTTKSLGSGERAGVISSYIAAFGRVPSTDTNWQDVIKIANGRWPAEKNLLTESKAGTKFKKIYLRTANMKNANDNAAITIMSYGLRPVKRNTNSEKSAILSFKYIYKKAPKTAEDWDIVRAIAYSGAKR